MNINESLLLLNSYLNKKNERRSFIICGGASLLLQGIISRTTRDVDIVSPPIDKILEEAAISVANDLGLDPHWLNCGPETIAKDLATGWDKRLIEVFIASNLTVFSISRSDLIFSKFWALCDRQKDKEDLLLINPTPEELDIAVKLTITKDANPDWPEWVLRQSILLKKELGHV
jgi:hypothetical protein